MDLNTFGVIECTMEPEIACYEIAIESVQNFNQIYEILSESGNGNKFQIKDKIQKVLIIIEDAIKKFWSKITGMIKKMNQNIWANTNNNKLFLKKYGNPKQPVDPLYDHYLDGYELDILNVNYAVIIKNAEQMIIDCMPDNIIIDGAKKSKFNDDENYGLLSDIDTLKEILNKNKSINRDISFTENLKKTYLGDIHKIKYIPFSNILYILRDMGTEKKYLLSVYRESEKFIKKILQKVNTTKKQVLKSIEQLPNEDSRTQLIELYVYSDFVNQSLILLSQTFSIMMKAINVYNRQIKIMARDYVSAINLQIKDGKLSKDFWGAPIKQDHYDADEEYDDDFFDEDF